MKETLKRYKNNPPAGLLRARARRLVPLIAGTAMGVVGLSRRSRSGLTLAAAGGALAYLGSRINHAQQDLVAHGSMLLNCPPMKAYRLYRNFEDLPLFMYHLESVTKINERQYRWIALGPMGVPIRWDVEIVDEREGEFISWRTLPGSDVTAEGSVRFQNAQGNRGTVIMAISRYDSLVGRIGHAVAKLFGKDPSFLMRQDLRRFKALVETGEIPTIDGQTHGPRSTKTAVLRAADPTRPMPRGLISEVIDEKRRIA
jgi:uncharacterized membrane protein